MLPWGEGGDKGESLENRALKCAVGPLYDSYTIQPRNDNLLGGVYPTVNVDFLWVLRDPRVKSDEIRCTLAVAGFFQERN